MSLNEATIEDLYRVPEDGKAEIVNGQLVLMDAEEKMATKCQDYFAAGTLACGMSMYYKRKLSFIVLTILNNRKSIAVVSWLMLNPLSQASLDVESRIIQI